MYVYINTVYLMCLDTVQMLWPMGWIEQAMAYFVFAVSIDTASSLQDVQGRAEVDVKTWPINCTNHHHFWQF